MVDNVDLQLGMDQDDLDKQLLAGTIDMDVQGNGVNPDAQHTVLSDPKLKADTDSALTGREWFIQLNTGVKPFDDIHCRKAVQYIVDKVEFQKAFGGENAGDIATTAMPPNMAGYKKFDLYPSKNNDYRGDVDKAKAEMAQCSQPNGFSTTITARVERDHEVAAATDLQSQLKQINITADIQKFPKAKYYSDFAGSPSYANSHNLGIMFGGWQPDWNDGYGMLDATTSKDGIKPAGGGNNLSQFDDPQIDAMFASAGKEPDASKRNAVWGQIDNQVMQDATMIPYLYSKALDYRPPQVTNVYVWQAYGTYDYIEMGVKR
jgi:peptide/nickel transport system substrate-binding protein